MESTKTRFDALDGLRGIAILLVFFNHIDITPIFRNFSPTIQVILNTFAVSGRTTVGLFFLLSGFLMAYIYPQVPNKFSFLQKRYTRIFPLFISAVFARFLLGAIPLDWPWLAKLLIILVPALFTHLVWVYGVHKFKVSRALFKLFIGLQIFIAFVYAFVIMRQPAQVFNQQLPTFLHDLFVILTNATLTLPFGNYIPVLDGVYWSLIAEVFFYLIYPFTFAPIASYFQKQSKMIIVFAILSLIPFFLGIDLLSKQIALFSIMDFSYFYYFVIGIASAYFIRSNNTILKNMQQVMKVRGSGYLTLGLLLVLFIALNLIFTSIDTPWHPLIRTVAALPFGLIFLTVLMPGSQFAKLLETKWLAFLGTISYSIYLTHTSIVDISKQVFLAHPEIPQLFFVTITFASAVLVSYLIYYLVERPYFVFKDEKSYNNRDKAITRNISIFPHFAILFSVYIIAIAVSFQSNFNLLSMEKLYSASTLISPKLMQKPDSISMLKYPKIEYRFKSEHDNIGIITMNITYNFADNVVQSVDKDKKQELIFRIKELGASEWYATSTYNPTEIGNSANHPFGFPVITNSMGKEYIIQLELSNPKNPAYISIHNQESAFKTVHQLNKRELLKSPKQLIDLIINRLTNILTNPEAHQVFYYMIPFFVLCCGMAYSKSKFRYTSPS